VTARSTLKRWLPPALLAGINRVSGRSPYFVGGWDGWPAAAAASWGYDDDEILRRVRAATREVIAGRAAFERDSVLFAHWVPPFQILAPLLRHAMRHEGRLEVVDFGGALGSTYRQCKHFLPDLAALRWHVIEQTGFASAGRSEFSTDELHFHASLETLPPALAPRLLLASSVLQYLPAPATHLVAWQNLGIDTLVIDRTPTWHGKVDIACVQHVPRSIYLASYPCWVLSRAGLEQAMQAGWRLICDFDCPEGRHVARRGPVFEFKGFVWERSGT